MDLSTFSNMEVILVIFLFLVGIQIFVDLSFLFTCYITGVCIIKLFTLMKTKYNIMSYGSFKSYYKSGNKFRFASIVGFTVWALVFLLIKAI
jgi:hypothetical protein